MADNHQYFRISDHVASVGNADLRLCLIVLWYQLEVVTQRFKSLDRLLDGELRTELDMFAERGLFARERRLNGDFNFAFLRPSACRHRSKQSQQYNRGQSF